MSRLFLLASVALLAPALAYAGGPANAVPVKASTAAPAPTAATNAAAIAALKTDMDTQFAAVLAAIAALPQTSGGSTTALTPNPPPVNGTANLTLAAGTYTTFGLFQPTNTGVSITGAGPSTIIQGQGGCPAASNTNPPCGTRLTWGKGAAYTQVTSTLADMLIENAGSLANTNGDGQAGVYAEGAVVPSTVTLNGVLLEGNEDGVFGSSNTSAPITLDATGSAWRGNGVGGNGYAHDIYWSSGPVNLTDDTFYGNLLGNDVKVKGINPTVTISGGWYGNLTGSRFVDLPDEGQLTSTGAEYVLDPASAGGNIFGDGEEAAGPLPAGVSCNWTITGGSLWIGRPAYIYVAPGCTIAFSGVAQHWTGASGYIGVSGGGTVTGLVLTPPVGFVPEASPESPVIAGW